MLSKPNKKVIFNKSDPAVYENKYWKEYKSELKLRNNQHEKRKTILPILNEIAFTVFSFSNLIEYKLIIDNKKKLKKKNR